MDILTHTLSGVAIATATATYVQTTPLRKGKILAIGALGGFWPDIDAVSMWSRFDTTFGQWFNLSHTGREIYGMKLWYSHHAFFHSILASLLFGLLLFLFIYFLYRIFRNKEKKFSFKAFTRKHIIYPITFTLAYWMHLFGDLPTPASVWGGIDMWWPLGEYVGGYGHIWWWNNYDIFLLVVLCIIINLLVPVMSGYIRKRKREFAVECFALMLSVIILQCVLRQHDYAYTGNTTKYAEMEENSKKEQERILGKRIYRFMEWFDRKMPFYF
jgi:membrane-bound metal-dependent hydrolase YbcI (DUF457 family)